MNWKVQNLTDRQTERGKIESLQALRALAFLGIFFDHAGFFIKWPTLGVSVFYVMSGFLMYYTNGNKSFHCSLKENLSFSLGKIKKLYPLHIVTMILAIILYFTSLVSNGGITFRNVVGLFGKIVLNITLLQTWVPYSSINVSLNGVAWYLSVTMFLYFMFPVLLKAIKKLEIKKLILLDIFILIIEILLCIPFIIILGENSPIYIWFMYCFPVFRLGDFWIGMSINILYLKNRASKSKDATIVEILMTMLTVMVFWILKKDFSNIFLIALHNWTTIFIPIAAAWVYLFANKNGLLTKVLSNRCMIYLGNISSYLFLIHYVITRYTNSLIRFLNLDFGNIQMSIIILAELILSILLSILYKNYFLNKKPYIIF